jgi:hypothetical protein
MLMYLAFTHVHSLTHSLSPSLDNSCEAGTFLAGPQKQDPSAGGQDAVHSATPNVETLLRTHSAQLSGIARENGKGICHSQQSSLSTEQALPVSPERNIRRLPVILSLRWVRNKAQLRALFR